ncbi:MAG: DUF1667 domain-containing protein [Candidatus Lokiarchaeota archaeon]|nr:DUF1667 domain-containing protein [Candidatus Lokiarchaeota archaeon]
MTECEDRGIIKTIRCIVCPTGCLVEVRKDIGGEISFQGYTCKRGLEYAQQEHFDPKRIITTTIRVEDGIHPLLPIRSDSPLLKEKLSYAFKIIAKTKVKAPIKMGDILIKGIADENVNIIASRDMIKKKVE